MEVTEVAVVVVVADSEGVVDTEAGVVVVVTEVEVGYTFSLH